MPVRQTIKATAYNIEEHYLKLLHSKVLRPVLSHEATRTLATRLFAAVPPRLAKCLPDKCIVTQEQLNPEDNAAINTLIKGLHGIDDLYFRSETWICHNDSATYFLLQCDHTAYILHKRHDRSNYTFLPLPQDLLSEGIAKIFADGARFVAIAANGKLYYHFVTINKWSICFGHPFWRDDNYDTPSIEHNTQICFSHLNAHPQGLIPSGLEDDKAFAGSGIDTIYSIPLSLKIRNMSCYPQRAQYFRDNPHTQDISGTIIRLDDPWLPGPIYLASPQGGTIRVLSCNASRSVIVVLDINSQVSTRRIDFDYRGCNPHLMPYIYSTDDLPHNSMQRKLPCAPWQAHKVPEHFKLTGKIGIATLPPPQQDQFHLSLEAQFKGHLGQLVKFAGTCNFIFHPISARPACQSITVSPNYYFAPPYFIFVGHKALEESLSFTRVSIAINPHDNFGVLKLETHDCATIYIHLHCVEGLSLRNRESMHWVFKGMSALELASIIGTTLISERVRQCFRQSKYYPFLPISRATPVEFTRTTKLQVNEIKFPALFEQGEPNWQLGLAAMTAPMPMPPSSVLPEAKQSYYGNF